VFLLILNGVNMKDILKLSLLITILFLEIIILFCTKSETTDVNRDGKTDIKDLLIVKKKIVEETERGLNE